jgi:uncharacterized repeat protein (TIGR01451 family)
MKKTMLKSITNIFSLLVFIILMFVCYTPVYGIFFTNEVTDSKQDGWVQFNGNANNANIMRTGDFSGGNEVRSFIGIDISGIPAGATIIGANLEFDAEGQGDPGLIEPYTISLVDFGNGLDAGDFDAVALGGFANFASFNSINNNLNSYSIPLGAAALQYLVDNSYNDFRIRIKASNAPQDNGNQDTLDIWSIDKGGAIPRIIVEYTMGGCSNVNITGFNPANGCIGDTIVISGDGFYNAQGTGTVSFNGTYVQAGDYISWSGGQISVLVPPGATSGAVKVSNSCGNIDTQNGFTVDPVNISGFNPASGCPGTTVTINGGCFEDVQGGGSVTFNGTAAASYISWSNTQILVTSPAGAGTGVIRVTIDGGDWDESGSTHAVGVPTITGFSPSTGCAGDTLLISGLCFGFPQGTGTVDFNGTLVLGGEYISWEESQVMVMVPPGFSTGQIQVVTPYGESDLSGSNFNAPSAPNITGFNPSPICPGSTLTINGSGFEAVQGTGKVVLFNNLVITPGDYVSWSDAQIEVVVPLGITTGPVTVTNNCGLSGTSAGNLSPAQTTIDIIKISTPSSNANYGDTVTYELSISNSGGCLAENILLTDTIPNGTSYVNGSLRFGTGPYAGATPVTDGGGDDQGSIAGSTITFALTNGTSPGTGGYLNAGERISAFFQVTITSQGTTNWIPFTVSITNFINGLDGTVREDLTMGANYLQAGDNAITNIIPGALVTNTLFSNGFETGDFSGWSDATGVVLESGSPLVGSYSARVGNGIVLEKLLPTTGYSNITITFTYNLTGTANNDRGHVAKTLDGGGSWPNPKLITYQNAVSGTEVLTPDPADTANNPLWGFRFEGDSLEGAEYFYVDEVIVKGTTRSSGTTNYTNLQVRGLTTFDLSSIPANANISGATLYIRGQQIQGDQADFQSVHVDHVDYGATFEGTDYNPIVIQSGYDNFSSLAANNWLLIDSTSQIIYSKTNNNRFQVMFRPNAITSDAETDAQEIYSAETAGSQPYITVSFSTSVPPPPITDIVTNEADITGNNFNPGTDTNYIVIAVVSNSNTIISITKSISNVMLGGTPLTSIIPGATVTYKLYYTNVGPGNAVNYIIYDQLPLGTKYMDMSTNGWTPQFTYSATPDQSWGSTDYSNTPPASPSSVQSIRWLNASIPAGASGFFTYEVIIK